MSLKYEPSSEPFSEDAAGRRGECEPESVSLPTSQVATAGTPSSFIIQAVAANDLYLTTGGEAFYAELARADT